MAVTAFMYGLGLKAFANKQIDWDTDSIYVALLTSSYTPDQDVHDYFDDVTAFQASGTGYTSGGQALAGLVLSYDAASNEMRMSASNSVWTPSSLTARYAVVYDRTPSTDATRPLISYVDFGASETSLNGGFEIDWSSGIVAKVVAA